MRSPRHAWSVWNVVAPASSKKSRSRTPASGTRSEAFLRKATNRASGNRAPHPLSPAPYGQGHYTFHIFQRRKSDPKSGTFRHIAVLCGLIALLSGCVAPLPEKTFDYTAFRSADPRSILIVPVVNNSVDVDASDYFLSAISQPVAERGYYVFPVNMVKRVMEEDGLADANMVHSADPTRLAALFGADSVLYISIERWDAQYAVLMTTVAVEFSYVLKDGHTGKDLWSTDQKFLYQSGGSGSSGNGLADLVIMLVDAAVTKASPNYMPLARQANGRAVVETHHGLPAGPYRIKEYGLDTDRY